MTKILDQNQDSNGELLAKYAEQFELPDFVRKADLNAEVRSSEQTPAAAFADGAARQFPCHTKAAAWMSTLYFLHNREQLPAGSAIRIGQQLEKFADYWGISATAQKLKQAYLEKQSSDLASLPDNDFAFVWVDEAGTRDRRLPLRNTVEVKSAAEWLDRYWSEFPFTDRHTIANKIMAKAAELGASLGTYAVRIEKMAGHGVCSPDKVVNQLMLRSMMAKEPQVKHAMRKMATTIKEKPKETLGPDELVKLAETIDQIDRNLLFNIKYPLSDLKRPEEFLFEVTYSEMQKLSTDHCVLTSGSIYHVTDFQKLGLSDVRDVFGTDFADDVTSGLRLDPVKFADIAATLPRPDAELLDDLMKTAGVAPVMKQAAKQKIGFTQDTWDAMAMTTAKPSYQTTGKSLLD
jgi:hypothetical protein